jgi:hypothetical protein
MRSALKILVLFTVMALCCACAFCIMHIYRIGRNEAIIGVQCKKLGVGVSPACLSTSPATRC